MEPKSPIMGTTSPASDWTTKDVAAFLGLKSRTGADWARERKTPHHLLGCNYRFVPEEIEAWRAARHIEARR